MFKFWHMHVRTTLDGIRFQFWKKFFIFYDRGGIDDDNMVAMFLRKQIPKVNMNSIPGNNFFVLRMIHI